MPIPLTYPGVYIQELPNPVHPIVGVPTSVAAFVGLAPQGVVDDPFQVNSFADYENEFGGLNPDWPLSYAVYLFFLNGGTTALVVRNSHPADTVNYSSASLSLNGSNITLEASSPGKWGTDLWATVDTQYLVNPDVNKFNLTIWQVQKQPQGSTVVAQEVYAGANLTKGTPQYLPTMLAASRLVTLKGFDPTTATVPTPTPSTTTVPGSPPVKPDSPNGTPGVQFAMPGATGGTGATGATGGTGDTGDTGATGGTGATGAAGGAGKATASGTTVTTGAAAAAPIDAAGAPIPLGDPGKKTGIYALTKADIFNILCLPVDPGSTLPAAQILEPAAAFCKQQRAMLIVDPPDSWTDIPLEFNTIKTNPPLTPSPNAAVYYPNLVLTDNTGANFDAGPSGAVAGVWAATDSSRGVWKAPAGTAATITGVADFTAHVDDGESGVLNPLAVNALRTMPAVGPVVWGARTTVGADQAQNQWKYLPIRRLALYIEESVRRGTQWAVFEPNDEPLWSSLRLNVTTFMQGLFRQGAFEGSTPADAYLVQCDANNNPQDQIELGIVNILVGFAPLYPAEFVIINIQQQAGQA